MKTFEIQIQNLFLNIFHLQSNSYVHSKHNPAIESDRFISNLNIETKNSKIIFFGFGAGYLLESFKNKFGVLFDIIIFEPIENLLETNELKKKFLT